MKMCQGRQFQDCQWNVECIPIPSEVKEKSRSMDTRRASCTCSWTLHMAPHSEGVKKYLCITGAVTFASLKLSHNPNHIAVLGSSLIKTSEKSIKMVEKVWVTYNQVCGQRHRQAYEFACCLGRTRDSLSKQISAQLRSQLIISRHTSCAKMRRLAF